jgi:hypothetical protein
MGGDLHPNFEGLGAARPALGKTRYFPAVVVGDRRADVTLDPLVARSRCPSGVGRDSLSCPHENVAPAPWSCLVLGT